MIFGTETTCNWMFSFLFTFISVMFETLAAVAPTDMVTIIHATEPLAEEHFIPTIPYTLPNQRTDSHCDLMIVLTSWRRPCVYNLKILVVLIYKFSDVIILIT